VAAHVAEATQSRADYIRHRAFDKDHYKNMVLSLLKEFGPSTRKEIDRLLTGKLPDILTPQQKENKIRNLLQEMSKKDKSIKPQGGPGWHSKWTLDEE
jgi:ATP-dependent DNA helicase RecG